MVDKVADEQVFLHVLRSSLVDIIQSLLHTHLIHVTEARKS